MTSVAPRRAPGFAGLLLVLPIAALLAVGAGGAENSALVLGPIATYALPVVAVVAFWWEDWPGTRLRPGWSGWADTALVIVAGIVLTGVGQAVTGHLDVNAIFSPHPAPGHVPTFPGTMALGGLVFIFMLEITLVGEGWPLRSLSPIAGGAVTLAAAWVIGVVADAALGGVDGADLGATLVLIGAWQVLCFVVWRGWPFTGITSRAPRLTTAHVAIFAAGIATFLLLHSVLGVHTQRLAAVTGCFIGAGLVVGMLFEDDRGMLAGLLATAALTALTFLLLRDIADLFTFERASADDWIEHVGLNALALSTILHVGIGRRWPFRA